MMVNPGNSDTIAKNSPPVKHKTFAEFFAGIGLMRLGLEREAWKASFANDIEREKYAMYSANFHDAAARFIIGDIHALDVDLIPDVALATASFPCNDLSVAGMRKGLGGTQSSAYWGFVRILEKMDARRPPIVLLENVAGFLTSHGGWDFRAALLALNRLGYSVDAMIIDASHFVPQSRVRLFVVGTLKMNRADRNSRESLKLSESEIRPKALADFISSHQEILWNIRELPPLPTTRPPLSDIVEKLPDDSPLWWSDHRRDYLVGQMSEKHGEQLRRIIAVEQWSYGTVFRRIRKGKSMAELRTDNIAGCLRTPRGGSGRQILVQAGYGTVKVRLLTPRECARLMGAEDFIINAPSNQALFGFGDAVCVPVIAWIAQHYLNPLVNEMSKALGEFIYQENNQKKTPNCRAIEM